ncbi:hypothetical protein [Saccharopolyspora mangrovi]|uniref:Uncharacterized protein n=1 Tax=Saccharopolyspora mangrovi TaxID=3082379 RepID=A0ABU6AE22_9PSEU|nr:hypothetical protein [Saccharopolyspora sp. S2-29]MEB3369807.1 hypothetical protein [Saccharopolyspora sp. S2-29]
MLLTCEKWWCAKCWDGTSDLDRVKTPVLAGSLLAALFGSNVLGTRNKVYQRLENTKAA